MPNSALPGQVVTTADIHTVAAEAATRLGHALRDALAARGSASLALSGGNTPRPAYEALAKQAGIDWAHVHVFWIDERAVPPDNPRSNYRLAKETLLDHAPIPAANVHRMPGEAADLEAAARAYEALLVEKLSTTRVGEPELPIFDAAVLGIGDDGHTASLFPGEPAVDETSRMVVSVGPSTERKTEARLTVTTPVLQRIRVALLLVTGKAKRGPLERISAATGTTRETPSRLYRGAKGSLVWLLDDAAAGAE